MSIAVAPSQGGINEAYELFEGISEYLSRLELIETVVRAKRRILLQVSKLRSDLSELLDKITLKEREIESSCIQACDHIDPTIDLNHDITNHAGSIALYIQLERALFGTSEIETLFNEHFEICKLLEGRGLKMSRN